MIGHRTITIEHLPNEVFLGIFSFHRLLSGSYLPLAVGRPPSAAWRWHTLAHVCQRWRDLIFSSLRQLEARLIIPRKSPKTPLDSWPALPLSVWYEGNNNYVPEAQEADVAAAFEHSDRIREIRLPVTMGYSLWRSICNKSFPELEHLTLVGPSRVTPPPEFLGSTTPPPRLRRILGRFPPSCITPTSLVQPGSRLSSPWPFHPHSLWAHFTRSPLHCIVLNNPARVPSYHV